MESGNLVFDPQEVADMRADSWMKEWTAPNDNRDNVRLQVEELRALALKQPAIRCDLTELDKALYTFNNATALGADRISPSFIKALPYQGKLALAQLITTILRTCRWPW